MLDPTLHHKGFIRVCLSTLHSSQKMFTKNTYLIPPSLHPPRSSLVDINGVEILLHHHHPDMFATHYLAPNAPLPGLNADPSSSSIPNAPPPRKQAVKKDRHSKIHTAQGPRDRRVRLSIGIARKFFDLQEMLGFDKPSKTLDWLLTKSKEAIKDLVHSKKKSTDVTDKSSSECELLSSAGNGEAYHDNGADSKSRFGGNDPPAPSNLVKESRAKARAKARARTREKMCIKQLNDQTRNNDLNILQNRNNNNQLEFFQLSAAATNNNINVGYPSLAAATDEDLIHESVSIKRKSKNPSFNLGFHQNVVVSRDMSSNYIVPSADHASQNWDVCSFTSQSNNYTILDQHKFINSNSNI